MFVKNSVSVHPVIRDKKSDLDEKMEKLGLKTGREKEVRTEINTRKCCRWSLEG